MNKNLRTRLLVVLGVFIATLYFSFPLQKRINLGLDLKGGMHIILKVETEKVAATQRNDAVLRTMEILRNRIDSIGVGETLIQRQGENHILIQLPGVTDREKAMAMIGKVAQLEFKLVESDSSKLKAALTGSIPEGYELKYTKEEKETEAVLIKTEADLTGDAVADARVDFDQTGFGEPKISLSLTAKGAKIFGDLTQKHVGERLAIVVDGEVLSAPNIREAILSGNAQITGMFSFEEASLLALQLRSGALPVPMHVEEERTIGPLLGQDSINAGIKATIIGLALVLIFMFIYYLVPGLVANVALVMNMFVILGFMGLLKDLMPASQVTLTLPGIAGIILTLGMAVDANVLINERIREELKLGKPLQSAIHNGYHRAFSAIFDSNVTTLIAALFLFLFGSGPIKGFAVTLTIGLLASLFTALYVTRTIFDVLIHFRILKSIKMLQLFPTTKIDFIAKRYFAYALSIFLVIWGIFTYVTQGENAFGIDFAGGQLQEYRFTQPVSPEKLRAIIKEGGVNDAVIQQFAEHPENVIVRTTEDTYDKVVAAFKAKLPENHFETLRIERVGPVVGKLLRRRAILAIIFALGGILVYVGIRFKHLDFAVGGVVALLHDVLVAAGLLLVFNRQIDLLVVTALLTIAGYSINDTIVIYDRVRENMPRMRKNTLSEIINLSLNQTLSRTILTSSVTLVVVIVLFLMGGEILNNFAFCLLIGFVVGCYSTVFIASPIVLLWHKKSHISS